MKQPKSQNTGRVPRPTAMYDLVYVVDGKVKEVVEENKSYSICKWKASQLKVTTHRTGLLQERKVVNRPKAGWS